ncbi:transposase [Alloprevotella tannerae]|uniref:transposase n=1 Tax=Alloprevotella tannerae TaxID=76122 RepID=UPI0028E85F5C|nr:transposase [Alloprevotella tannerae]
MEIYCIADDFCKEYELGLNKKALSLSNPSPNTPKTRNRKGRMSDAEMITILVLFHSNTFRNFKLSDIEIKALRSVIFRR